MGIGLGVVMLLLGLVVVLDVITVNIPYVADSALGVLLVVTGAATIVLALKWASIRSRGERVEENHYGHHHV